MQFDVHSSDTMFQWGSNDAKILNWSRQAMIYNLRFLNFDGQIVHRIRMVLYIRSIRWREPLTFPTGNETAGGGLIDTTMCYMFLFNRERTFHNGPSWIERLSHLLSIVVLEEATSLLLLPFTTTLPHSKDLNFSLTLL